MRLSEPYKRRKVNGRRVSEHREVMERVLGRPLSRDEHVHHINYDTRDNRPENLQLVTAAKHARLHHTGRMASHETRAKMSARHKGNQYSKGYKHTAETLAKRHESRAGVPWTPVQRINITAGRRKRMKTYVFLSPDGQQVEVKGLADFCLERGLSVHCLQQVIGGWNSNHKGWRFLEVRNEHSQAASFVRGYPFGSDDEAAGVRQLR